MRYEKFVAQDMAAALAVVKDALGPDAVIVGIRQRPRQGFWRRARVEITAQAASAREGRRNGREGRQEANRDAPPPYAPRRATAGDDGAPTVRPACARHEETPPAEHGQSAARGSARADGGRADGAPASEHAGAAAGEYERRRGLMRQLEAELAAAREALRQKDAELAQLHEAAARRLTPPTADAAAPNLLRDEVRGEFDRLKRMLTGITLGANSLGQAAECADASILQAADVDPDVAQALLEDLAQAGAPTGGNAAAEGKNEGEDVCALERLKAAIALAMPTVGDFFGCKRARRIALVGPTGVGKTTTIAKIAAHAALRHELRVALVGLDTYRIGATEQLGHYARLIGVPVRTAFDRESFVAAMQAFDGYDLVLIDTAGRGPTQAGAHCLQLRELFAGQGVQIYLTLAAATRRLERQEMLQAMGDLAPLNARALVLTKLDEAVALGSALSLTHATGLPLAFVTSGQRVPEDLTPADAARLADHMVERVLRGQADGANDASFSTTPTHRAPSAVAGVAL